MIKTALGSGTMSLKKLLRQALAAVLFIIFGIICMVGNLIFLPIVILGLHKFKTVQNLSRDSVWLSWKFFIAVSKIFGYLDYKFDIKTDLGKNSQMIVANHPSLIDVVFLISKIRRANCIVKGDLTKNVFLSFAIKACGYIPNTANEELLERSVCALENGENLIVFPEGTRTKDEINFHKAASHIATKAASEIIGIAINMQPRSLRKGEPWYSTPDVMIKYDFYELFCLDMKGFFAHKPNPIRAKELHRYMNEIYRKEFECKS
ncbi:lysophospholipid acyltransferase family protein [Campylobacter sp. RM15925]|uniref:lysophospholipid acyltransferase family protein n=1 Tax=Campylobacter sp. RM15925 TaxID=1705724 RepID=UPI0032E41AD7